MNAKKKAIAKAKGGIEKHGYMPSSISKDRKFINRMRKEHPNFHK